MLLLSVLWFSVITMCCGDYLKTYYMNSRCGDGISMIRDNVYMARLRYSHLGSRGSVNCTMSLLSHFDKIALRFTEFSFPDCRVHLSIRIGDDYPSGRLVPGLGDIMCGPTSPPLGAIYTTDWTEIHMRVEGSSVVDTNFTMLFNAFENERKCYKFEQHCKNGRCIHDSIRCNGHNPCGDESDCDDGGYETGEIVGIAFGCGGGFLFILFLMFGVPKIVKWKVNRNRAALGLPPVGRSSNTNGTETSRDPRRYGHASDHFSNGRVNPGHHHRTSDDNSHSDSLGAYDDIDLSDTAAQDAESDAPRFSDLAADDMEPDALGFNSHPPAYSMIDYVSVPGGTLEYSPETSAHAADTTNTNGGISDGIRSCDNGGVGRDENSPADEDMPPPPPYDVVVQHQAVYDVSDTVV